MADQMHMESLPGQDQRLVRSLAADAGTTPEAMLREIVRAYLGLVRSAPAALPNDPLRRLTTAAIRKGN